jgi:hypothetical protein
MRLVVLILILVHFRVRVVDQSHRSVRALCCLRIAFSERRPRRSQRRRCSARAERMQMEDPSRTIYSDPRVPGDDEALGEKRT